MRAKVDKVIEADVLVIGGGLAGCFTAIKAKESGANKVVQIDKGMVGKSGCSALAAGALFAFCPEEDDFGQVFKEIVERADFLIDQERLKNHLEEIWDRVTEMESFDVEFEKTEDGRLRRHLGRGNIKNVMFHGPQLMDAMAKATRKKGVAQFHKTMMTDLLTKDDRVVGAIAFSTQTGEFYVFKAKATVLATGFNWYKGRDPGNRSCTGDGYVAAYQAGCDITHIEISHNNFFPANYDIGPGMSMYVGTGGFFINSKDERFMERYDPVLKDRALQNILAPSFAMEVKRGNTPIYIDMTHFTEEQVQLLKKVIPLPMRMYERVNIIKNNRFVNKIELMATAPNFQGGPLVNIRFETYLPGLYACGDSVPYAGLEGGQCYMAGAATSGATAGRSAAQFAKDAYDTMLDKEQVDVLIKQALQPIEREDGIEPDQVLLSLQEAIFPYDVLMLRDEERMKKAIQEVKNIRENQVPLLFAYDPHYLRMALEARNMVNLAEMQLRSAIFRRETRERAVREDYPYRNNIDWLKWVSIKKSNSGMEIFTQDLPIENYPIKPEKMRVLHPIWQRAKELGIITIKGEKVVWV